MSITTARLRTTVGHCLLAAFVVVPAWAQGTAPHAARPGSVNYVEGQANLDATPLDASCIGTIEMAANQSVITQAGKVEILLTPGIFLRLADNSSLKMISPDLARTEVELDRGRALVEVVTILKDNDVIVDTNGAKTRLLKAGLYDFDIARNEIRVFKGSAEVTLGAKKLKLGGSEKVDLNADGLKARYLDARQFEDEFYRWNGLRSGYLSEASVSSARSYIGAGPGWYGPGWAGMGWYWNPWFGVYTFLPVDGVYAGPFGWAFYSPIEVFHTPFIFYGDHPHPFGEFHPPYGHGFPPPAGHGGGRGR